MPWFEVSFLDPQRGVVQQQVQALNAGAVAQQLRLPPSALLSVQARHEAAVPRWRPGRGFPLRSFAQQLAVLLAAGVPVREALATLRDNEAAPAVAGVIAALVARIEQGESLSVALQAQPQAFDEMFCAVVAASERSGQLQQALAEQAEYLGWVQLLRDKLVAAAIYPITLIAAGSAVLLFLLLFVVPRFAGMLDGVGGELPWASRLLIELGRFGGEHPVPVALALLSVLLAPVLAWPLGLKAWLQARLHGLPLLGPRLRLLALAQLYRCLGMLLQAGVPITTALPTARAVIHARLRPALDQSLAAVQQGERLSNAFERAALGTPVSLRMLRVGEHSGQIGPMLVQAARFYDEELSRLSELVTRLVNPLLMLLMGGVIGTVVVLMYLPIFQLVEQVG